MKKEEGGRRKKEEGGSQLAGPSCSVPLYPHSTRLPAGGLIAPSWRVYL